MRQTACHNTLIDEPRRVDAKKARSCGGETVGGRAGLAGRGATGGRSDDEALLHFGVRLWVKGRVAAVARVARALENSGIVSAAFRNPKSVTGLSRLRAGHKLDALVDVITCCTAISVAGINLHRRDVPQCGRVNKLGVTVGVAVKGFTRLSPVSLRKHLARRDGCVGTKPGRRLVNEHVHLWGAVRRHVLRVGLNSLQLRMLARYPHHVVMIVCPVDRHRDIIFWKDAWHAERADHHLVHLVSCDRNSLARKAFDDLVRQWIVALVRPEYLSIMSCNLRSPHIKVFMAFRGIVVIEGNILAVS
mmetsp:Transcript_20812/g.34310  ORF Transcript_20812/g.34310 Transcript_20812/m.34310 type:complete len:304 (+) Transcript_20812:1837-2748(+)